MHSRKADISGFSSSLATSIKPDSAAQIVICPPAPYIGAFPTGPWQMGAQDCSSETKDGAFTGDISANMLADCGAHYVILGHSERRAGRAESSLLVASKLLAAQAAGLTAILCVGESAQERAQGLAFAVVQQQLALSLPQGVQPERLVIAYEPVWAIGTGVTPSLLQIDSMHQLIHYSLRQRFAAIVPVLYGGSVKPENAADILSIDSVNGALVGGASLKAESFAAIIHAAVGAAIGAAKK